MNEWIESAVRVIGLEAEPVETSYAELDRFLRRAGPAILRLPGSEGEDGPRFLALLGGRRQVSVLAPDLKTREVATEAVRAALCRNTEPVAAEIDRMLEEAGVSKRNRPKARAALLRERLGAEPVSGCWMLRLEPGTNFGSQFRREGLLKRLAALVGAHATQYALWILSWWLIGKAALNGRLDWGWLMAWALLLLTIVPFLLLTTWVQGRLAIGTGGLLKQRLLSGALRLEPEEVRQDGAGRFLGRVIESQAVESLTLSGGFLALVSALELIFAALVLGVSGLGILLPLLLMVWIVITLLTGWRYFRRRRQWTTERLAMTHDLVESMMGYRTRLAQEAPERRHDQEDAALARYLESSTRMDGSAAALMALIPRGWLVLGAAGISPAFMSASGGPAALAIGLGGILLAYRALRRLSDGVWNLAGAAIAWEQVSPLFHAASRPASFSPPGALALKAAVREAEDGQPVQPLIAAHELVFRYVSRVEPVLRGCSLRVWTGDRILLEGPSGGGKSTIGSLLMGLRIPQSGLLFAGGLDRQSLGLDGWRQRVAGAPQFHENHVLTGTFAFNLLMGRAWPPGTDDLAEAETVCNELGLGELLARMPAGLLQTVGETGWQLSHGERSRLYIARALLQNPDLIILDESFAQLDPENLRRALSCVLERAKTLLVIAHP